MCVCVSVCERTKSETDARALTSKNKNIENMSKYVHLCREYARIFEIFAHISKKWIPSGDHPINLKRFLRKKTITG